MSNKKNSLLKVSNLAVSFDTVDGSVNAVQGIDFELNKGQTLAIIGESGSGKSVTASVIMGILTCPPGRIKSGKIFLNNQDILKLSDTNRRKLMGSKIAIIFQDTLSHLNPVFTVGSQIAECFEVHKNYSKKESWDKTLKLLERVKIPNPIKRAKDYPHQFSGGQRQRVMIAMALALEPDIIIADEPTTALDVTIQAKILELLAELRDERNMGLILITHDLGIAGEVADNVIVLKNGKIVELDGVANIQKGGKHRYTKKLISSIPSASGQREKGLLSKPDSLSFSKDPILEVKYLKKVFESPGLFNKTIIKAVDGVSFEVFKGEIIGLVGESGSGKSTIAKLITRLIRPSAGSIHLHGKNKQVTESRNVPLEYRKTVQMVFQDPFGSLNSVHTVYHHLARPLIRHGLKNRDEIFPYIVQLLEKVGLKPGKNFAEKFPHEMSGGERQRVAIARALSLEPQILVADEPTSMLDVSIRMEILEIFAKMRKENNLTVLFITHDLASARYLADRIIVLKNGMVIEENKKLEDAQKEAEDSRKKLFSNYIADGKKNWEKNKSHFKGSYIAEDMVICSKLTEDN